MFTTLTLSDGRALEYAELGAPSGQPVLFFHGTPATGGQAAVVADAASAQGLRLVAPTRPGYGDSTVSRPGLAATAADTLELVDQLGLGRFALMGSSGGGPFALATAAAAPDRVSAIWVHASPGSYAEVKPDVLGDDDRRALDLAADGDVEEAMRVMDALGDADLGELRGLSEEEFSQAMSRMAPPGESWLDRHPALKQAFQADFRRAITTSAGMSRDNLSWLRDWDVDLEAVLTPVRLVYGDNDRMAELGHAEWLQARLSRSDLHVVPGSHGDVVFGAAADSFAAI
ncbi:alpha/beta hydrolase [Nocardioides sp.]|uniref:alpha/beta fold hydrolase n=1 Tax=Nocardioides sp. TaxID=35761 RepID=UPI002F3FE261